MNAYEMVRKAEKAVYTESGGTKKHPFWGPCIYKGERSAAVQESLKSQNEQLQTGKNDEAESFKSKETTVIQEHTTLQ